VDYVVRILVVAFTGFLAGCGEATPRATSPVTQGSCPHDSICFNVLTGAPGPLGPVRLYVLWAAPDRKHDSPDVVEVASLSGQERSVVVPISAIRRPARVGAYGVTWGYVFALPANVDVASGPSPKEAVGIAQMMLTDALPLATQLPLRETYPNGLAPGIAGYRMAQVNGSGHDKFFLAPPGSVFDLVICPTVAPKCQLPAPNPT
jgi:hypothetical protein